MSRAGFYSKPLCCASVESEKPNHATSPTAKANQTESLPKNPEAIEQAAASASAGPRSYGQFCALARSLDIVGDRWTLLIVRELLPGPMRYTELKTSLEGIATNLLSERLKTMEANRIVERRLDRTSVVYALTRWGAGLREPMEALGRWGAPLLATGQGDDNFRPRWLTLALPALLRGVTASPPVELGIETDGFLMVLRVDEGGPCAFVPDQDPATVFIAAPDVVVALAAGTISPEQAVAAGTVRGDSNVLRTVFGRVRANVAPPANSD